jgi:CRISPR-associated RAMP protein (TIGR02581 family)
MAEVQNRYELRNRYLFEGQLVMQTALHIGGGRASLSPSDSPVVLTPTGHPFIPGSSFKGALRSTVEKLAPELPLNAALSSCALIELPEQQQIAETRLIAEKKQENATISCPTARPMGIRSIRREWEQRGDDYVLEKYEFPYLCSTCWLFGSPFAAARVNVNDLYLTSDEWMGGIQVRDGAAIDRDSETAKDGLKYDFEVVPASAMFQLRIVLENATEQDLQLISVGLSEFVHGFGMIGGKRSRGLGACELQNLTVSSLELRGVGSDEGHRRLQDYLISRKFSTEREPGKQFLARHIESIFTTNEKG